MDVFHYGILNIIKLRQKFIFQEDEKNNCTVIRNDYLEILETSLDKLNEAYVDSVNEDELIKSGIK